LRYLGAAREVAQDLTQETFVVAFQKNAQGQLNQTYNLAAWLRGVSRNLFLAFCRRNRTSPVHIDSGYVERAEGLWAHEFIGADCSDHLAALRQCLQRLPRRQQEMLRLQYSLQKSRAEIAAVSGLTEDGVKTAMRRLRAALGQCIQRRLGLAAGGGAPQPEIEAGKNLGLGGNA
jgi:RNA polymerase sigma-70 factor (ECF subfamily)